MVEIGSKLPTGLCLKFDDGTEHWLTPEEADALGRELFIYSVAVQQARRYSEQPRVVPRPNFN